MGLVGKRGQREGGCRLGGLQLLMGMEVASLFVVPKKLSSLGFG